MSWGDWRGGFPPKLSPAEKARLAREHVRGLQKSLGRALEPVTTESGTRAIATSAWGKAWCVNLESYAELANRLDRGRTYVRSGAVLDLTAHDGAIDAWVSGSELYRVQIRCAPVAASTWDAIRRALAGKVGSLVALLQGELDDVMQQLSRREAGLFPTPRELSFQCECPDGAHGWMCKHVAAALYAFGRRLDRDPALLFALRHTRPDELVDHAATDLASAAGESTGRWARLDGDADALSKLFRVEIHETPTRYRTKRRPPAKRRPTTKRRASTRARRS